MSERVIEGVWDDLVDREDLRGRRVRVTVIDDETTSSPEQSVETAEKWVDRLRAWAASHRPIDRPADDDRDSIYADDR
jgi:hypothetical protein